MRTGSTCSDGLTPLINSLSDGVSAQWGGCPARAHELRVGAKFWLMYAAGRFYMRAASALLICSHKCWIHLCGRGGSARVREGT
jgi:hypothetical protein